MKSLRYIYKTKTLREYGIFILSALVLVFILGNIFIPSYPVQDVDEQLLSLKGKYLKYDDGPHVQEFLRSVKRNGGYICMGTSESTSLRDGNYYEFLDQDTSIAARFSILGGAGRTCGLHMPMIINHLEDIDSLRLIYFINPVYWRSELNHFDKGYWKRYLNYGLYREMVASTGQDGFTKISARYNAVTNPFEKMLYRFEYYARKWRKPFFHDLRYLLSPSKYLGDLDYSESKKEGTGQFDFFGRIDTAYLDTSWNVSHEFMGRTWLNPIVDNSYRSDELKAFIRLCRDAGADVTYVLGPVNEIYIAKYHPPYLDGYQSVLDHIASILQEEQADWIDMTYLGNIPGSFIDNQHHSSYGASLIYRDIKIHLDEKNGL